MNKLTKRRIGIVAGVLLIVLGVLGMNYLSNLKKPPPRNTTQARAPKVTVMPVQNSQIPTTLEVQGQLVAFDKIDIFSEVTGTLENTGRPFKVGTYYPKGSVLIRIDDDEARLNLLSQKSSLLNVIAMTMPDLKIDYPESFPQWEAYLTEFDPQAKLPAFPEAKNDAEKRFIASRNLLSQYYTIKSAEERLSKYVTYAPFSGVLTTASINPGAVVRVGQQLGTLMQTGNYELVATVPLSELSYIQTGNTVSLYSDDLGQNWEGKVKRISDQIDPGSQTVQVFISVSGKALREGMYLRGEVNARTVDNAMKLSRDLLVDQNKVYTIVNDTTLRLQPVEVVHTTRDYVVIRGLENGAYLLDQRLPTASDGMRVDIRKEETSDPKNTAAEPDSTSLSQNQ